jgi:hypothetical protein
MTDKLTSQEWGDILLILDEVIGEENQPLIEKVRKALEQANKIEYERSCKQIRVGVWVKKINDLIKQAIGTRKPISNRKLGNHKDDVSCSVLKPKLRRLVCGGEEIYKSKLPVREVKIQGSDEEQAKLLFEKIRNNPPQIKRKEAIYFRISWDHWSEVHLSITKDKIEWNCPHWDVWGKGEVQRTLEEA